MDGDEQIMEVLFEKYPILKNDEFIKSKRLKINIHKKIKEKIDEEGYKLYEQYVVAYKKRKEKIKLDELEESKKTLEWRLKYESEITMDDLIDDVVNINSYDYLNNLSAEELKKLCVRLSTPLVKVRYYKTNKKRTIENILKKPKCPKIKGTKNKVTKNKGTKKKGNKGEKGEINIIKFLFNKKNDKDIIKKIFNIESRIILINPNTRKEIHSLNDINKSSWLNKADIIVDFIDEDIKYHPSIKCNDGSPPTLLNHTNRSANCFKNYLKEEIKYLDEIIKMMNDGRSEGIFKEDIPYIKLKLSDKQIECMITIIKYFTFQGTGSKISKCRADSILFVENSEDFLNNFKFTDCKEEEKQNEYIKDNLPKLRFCMRSGKGMPGKKSKGYEDNIKLCEKWIYEYEKNGVIKLCGALHIRYI